MPFKPPKQKAIQQQEQQVATIQKAFQIYFTKDLKKKHKTMSDGLLIYENSKVYLYNMEGKQIYNGYGSEMFDKENQPFQLGYNLVEVIDEISFEDFKSGRIFIKQQQCIPMVKMHKKRDDTPFCSIPTEFNTSRSKENRFYLNETCYIDSFLAQKMRDHQKEGVKFMFECVVGLRGSEIQGCILADSMGLGKTIQSIALIWVLLKQNPHSQLKPFVRKVLIVAPVSLVQNWAKEIQKWLGQVRLIPLVAMGLRDEVLKQIDYFRNSSYNCLITSYEVLLKYAKKLDNQCDLMILDEGHRLKNNSIKTFTEIAKMKCQKRIILTGTPIQNCMKEFFACCDFVNPGIFGQYKTFRQVFEDPINAGMQKEANDKEQELGQERSTELNSIITKFILRRKADILAKILPDKFEYAMFCKMTHTQIELYKQIIEQQKDNSKITMSLLNQMRKVLTHPDLIEQNSFVQLQYEQGYYEESGKMICLKILLDQAIKNKEKFIIVSYYNQTLDLVEKYLNNWSVQSLRLDGSVQNKKRQQLVDQFNSSYGQEIVFLLNGKSGGTGLNLIGANRMVMMDIDWNPANDLQVMARMWRDGQKKTVHIYRLICCGTYEERILQRQQLKEILSKQIVDEDEQQLQDFSQEELKKLFKFKGNQKCLTYSQEENEINQLENEILKDQLMFLKIFKTSKGNSDIYEDEEQELEQLEQEQEQEILEQEQGDRFLCDLQFKDFDCLEEINESSEQSINSKKRQLQTDTVVDGLIFNKSKDQNPFNVCI